MLDVPDLDVADFFRDVADSENWTLRTGFFTRCGFFGEKMDVADLTFLDVADRGVADYRKKAKKMTLKRIYTSY